MSRSTFTITVVICAFFVTAPLSTRAQATNAPYANMAPLDQYMMDRDTEIALARSAAPPSISGDAEVLVMGRQGYESAVKGTNGFVCLVERSWTTEVDDPEFWNPKVRAPICFNPSAARSVVPLTLKKTELVLAGRSRIQMSEDMDAALSNKEFPGLEPGAMCYMMSKMGHLNDGSGHWHPHLMFFVPLTKPASWGANLPQSPVLGSEAGGDRMTVFFIPVAKWSDGSAASMEGH